MGNQSVSETRVLLLHNFMTPYRVPLFAELAKRFDFEVWILGDVRKIREWGGESPGKSFRYRVMAHASLPLGSRDYRLLLNPTLSTALRRHRHDVTIACGWDTPASFWVGEWTRRRGRPFVLWSGSTQGEPNWRRSVTRPLVRRLVSRADAWIAYGTRAKGYLESLGAEGGRVFCAYNTVDTDEFARRSQLTPEKRAEVKRRLGVGSSRVILYCGQLIERKGLGDLIPAFAGFARQCPGVMLVLVGSGARARHYRAQCEKQGITDRVIFAGFVPREELPGIYGVADLAVLPSREEVWGLVINEALSCGVPVVTTDVVGASADLMADGRNGYVVPAHAPEALREAFAEFFDEKTDRDAMTDSARQSIEPFTIARAADAFEEAVACALRRRSP